MEETIIWTVEGLDKLAADVEKVRQAAPDLLLKQINRAGNKFRKDCIEETKQKVNKRRGNLLKGYRKKVVVSRSDGAFSYEAQITGGNGKARHFHLIENGHRQTAEYFYRKGYKTICHSNEGFVKGYKIVEGVRNRWNSGNIFAQYAKAAVDEALKKGALND